MAAPGTRERILDAALELFRERGYDETTMREIAAHADVATGLAYYYFKSKADIVLAFYHRTRDELPAMLEAAHKESRLGPRLTAMIEAKFAHFRPNRRFLGALVGHAADASHPLSPFSDESRELRELDQAQYQRALDETRTAVPKDLAPHMAKILWMYQMGLLLFWTYDRSPQQRRSKELLQASVSVVVTLLKLCNLPLLKPARTSVLRILAIVES